MQKHKKIGKKDQSKNLLWPISPILMQNNQSITSKLLKNNQNHPIIIIIPHFII